MRAHAHTCRCVRRPEGLSGNRDDTIHTHIHTRVRARAHTHRSEDLKDIQGIMTKNIQDVLGRGEKVRTRAHTCARARTHTRTWLNASNSSNARACAHAHTRANKHTYACRRERERERGGWRGEREGGREREIRCRFSVCCRPSPLQHPPRVILRLPIVTNVCVCVCVRACE